jgi:hypothetical protein
MTRPCWRFSTRRRWRSRLYSRAVPGLVYPLIRVVRAFRPAYSCTKKAAEELCGPYAGEPGLFICFGSRRQQALKGHGFSRAPSTRASS